MKTKLGEIKLIIFDWSGVISDDRQPVYEANMKILERYDKPRISYNDWWSDLKMTLRTFLKSQEIPLSREQINEIFKECYDEVFQSGILPTIYLETLRILELLSQKGMRLAAVSAHPLQNLEREARIYKIRNYFIVMLGWATAHKSKSILKVCKDLAISPENAIYVGDMIMDIRSAKEARVHSVGIARDNNESYHSIEILEKENPEILARNLDDMLEKLGVCA